MTHAALRTRLCELCGIEIPIVQTGMGWVAGPRLTSATSNAGGLGILAGATMDLAQLRDAITETKSRTDKPFGVNLRADQPDSGAAIDLLINERVKVASFAMAPSADLIHRLQDAGVVVIPSIGAKRHAEKVAAWGVDAVLVQGGEGGGHTGSVPTSLLLPQVVDTVDIPVIAAGGFFDGRGLVAALAYGASGIAMGTRFLLTRDSTVPDAVKDEYLTRTVNDTVVTNRVDGVPHRVLRTDFVERLDRSGGVTSLPRALRNAWRFKRLSGTSWRALLHEGRAMRKAQDLTWSQVLMAANTPMLLKAAMVDGRPDLGVMASGQAVGVIDDLPSVAELIERIMKEADDVLTRLTGSQEMRRAEGAPLKGGGRGEGVVGKTRVPAVEGWFTMDDEPALLGRRGTTTGAYFFPPDQAFSRHPDAPTESLEDVQLSRRGRVWSWTTNHYQPPAPYVAPDPFVPYTVLAVELVEEQMVVLGPLAAGADPDALTVGTDVELVLGTLFEDDEHEYVMWAWQPTGGRPVNPRPSAARERRPEGGQ